VTSDVVLVPEAMNLDTAIPVAGVVYVLMAGAAAVHVLLHKRNEGAAVSWLGIILLSPFFGALLYALFGINRMRGRAQSRHSDAADRRPPNLDRIAGIVLPDQTEQPVSPGTEVLMDNLTRTGAALHGVALCGGNSISPLVNGDEAYPAMLEAIAVAQHSVLLSSYIFQHDTSGRDFVTALTAAHKRGVVVRVLVDGIGARSGFWASRADRALQKFGVPTARFLSAFSPRTVRFINLRNHRKLLVVDGKHAFVGGMNIRHGNVLKKARRHLTADVHFEVLGPVVQQISVVFLSDWFFATGETLTADMLLPKARAELPLNRAATAHCRVLVDGPDNNYQKLRLALVAALNSAQSSIIIVTPYFLPHNALLDAMQLAVLRGVEVQIMLPRRNNLRIVEWAMRANEKRWLSLGLRLWLSEPPFDHSKFFIVDERWAMIGSSNWDARSLELNFEINVECVDVAFNQSLRALYAEKCAHATEIFERRDGSLLPRLRNNFCRLFSPHL